MIGAGTTVKRLERLINIQLYATGVLRLLKKWGNKLDVYGSRKKELLQF